MNASELLTPAVLTPALFEEARMIASRQSSTMWSGLQQVSALSAEHLLTVVGAYFRYPVLTISALQNLRPNFDMITYPECVQRGVLVTRAAPDGIFLVLTDPFDSQPEDWGVRRCARIGCTPLIALTDPDTFKTYLTQQEQHLRAINGVDFDHAAENDEAVAAIITLSTISDDASPVVKLVNSTIYDALKLRVSDIHLECEAQNLHVSYRIDGVLVPITLVQGLVEGSNMAEQVISRIKVMAELDIAERRIPQDGRFKVRVNNREIDFRVSIMPNIFGEDAVLRLLDRQALTEEARALRLDHLGLDPYAITAIRQLTHKPHGMLLVTGPTGSGKTTTLYAAITEIHTGSDKIITIEDPVEYRLPRVLQIPVNEKKGLTFARGLRSILRHDPDKIMVGEIRDGETAQIAVQAALTGHLVFTTVHANNVFDVLGRFLHMGVDTYSFTAALNGIVAQRLLRLNCTNCAIATTPDLSALTAAGFPHDLLNTPRFMRGTGCNHCRGVGYKGRKAIAEVLMLDDPLREMITGRAPITQVKEYAAKNGLRPLRETAWGLVAQGETTLDEVMRVAG